MITKIQECFPGTDGNCNAMGLQNQQKKLKIKPTKNIHTWTNQIDAGIVQTRQGVG